MTENNITVNPALVKDLLTNQDGIAKLVESVLNQVLEAQVTASLGAEPHERTDERQGYRNGYRPRKLYTRVGPITLQVPQTRDGSFSTDIFKRYQRSEQAFVLALMEMVVQGVSTRKVSTITEELCGTSFSKSTVSSLCSNLSNRVNAFNDRRLEGTYPFILVDAMFIKARQDDRVVSRAVLIVTGVRHDGVREILGVRMGDSECYTTWDETFQWLKRRGLKGVYYVISDHHGGLKDAIRKHFQGATWQRCQVHLMRNIMHHSPRRYREDIMAQVKLIMHSEDMREARRRLDELTQQYESKASKAMQCLLDGFDDAMAVTALPGKYRKRLRTTNMVERLNEEVRRRERVIRIFPNDESALRLIGALLAEKNEQWIQRRYLEMDEFNEWRDERTKKRREKTVIELA